MQSYAVAVLGATGLIGETIIDILAERGFPVRQLFPLASARSTDKTVVFKNKSYAVLDAAEFDFAQADIVLSSAGSEAAATYLPLAVEHGCIVIDNSSCFRQDPEVPLVIPEVNPEALIQLQPCRLVANPNCCVIQLLVALKPLHDAVGIEQIQLTSYQSVAGAGFRGITELAQQTSALLNAQAAPDPEVFAQQIAFNVVPQVGPLDEQGYTGEEIKIVQETRKILGMPQLKVDCTAVRVPTFYGHGLAVHIETQTAISVDEANRILHHAPGVIVQTGEDYPTPFQVANAEDAVYVGRLRTALVSERGLNMWVVANNVRKGGALNAVQIAELLIARYQ